MVNYTEYVTLCKYENGYDMYLNHDRVHTFYVPRLCPTLA